MMFMHDLEPSKLKQFIAHLHYRIIIIIDSTVTLIVTFINKITQPNQIEFEF